MLNVALLSALTYLHEIDQSIRMITPQVDRHINGPYDKVAFLEIFGLVFDTGINGIILEDKLEVGLRTFLHKVDRYFYETISCLLWGRMGYIPFKWT